jgi:phosphoserine phosphatase
VSQSKKPLCVDLDGTLIRESVTIKAIRIYAKRGFLNAFKILFWTIRGLPYLRQKLAESVDIDPSSLNYNREFLEFIFQKEKEGRKIFLATGCNQIYANKIADYLGIFSGVFASSDRVNLVGKTKAQTLVALFGKDGFSYAGDSEKDVYVWNESAECILVSPSEGALEKMRGREYLLFE